MGVVKQIDVRVDDLVLHGFPAEERDGIAAIVETRLQQYFAQQPPLAGTQAIDPETIGAHLSQAIQRRHDR